MKKAQIYHRLKIAILVMGASLLVGAMYLVIQCAIWIKTTPLNLDDVDRVKLPVTSPTYARDAHDALRPIGDIYLERRSLLTPDQLPQLIIDAVRSAEDRRFFSHPGIDIWAFGAVAIDVARTRRLRGGSTITQQLIKPYISKERTLRRKVVEAAASLRYEARKRAEHKGNVRAAKLDILTRYLNQIYMGDGTYGWAEASKRFFSTDITTLTAKNREHVLIAAALAALPKGPENYLKLRGSDEDRQRALEKWRLRRNYVLKNLAENGVITHEELVSLSKLPVKLNLSVPHSGVCDEFVTLVERKLKAIHGPDLPFTAVPTETTCRIPLQQLAQQALTSYLKELHRKNPSWPVPEGAAIVINKATREVEALVGSAKPFQRSNFIRGLDKPRQAGSLFKVLAYYPLLAHGFLPSDVFEDKPVTVPPLERGAKPWTPKNSHKFTLEPFTLRRALARSLNSVAVTASYELGLAKKNPRFIIPEMLRVAEAGGIRSKLDPYFPLILGSSSVTLLEMTNFMATVTSLGEYREPRFIRREYRDGAWHTLTSAPKQTLDPAVCFLTTDLLTSVITDRAGTGRRAHELKTLIAGKTGTSNDEVDAWFIGCTTDYCVGVWIGHDTPRPLGLNPETGRPFQGASTIPVFNTIMKHLIAEHEPGDSFPVPAGVVRLPTVLEENDNGQWEPRCATDDDSPELVFKEWYLKAFVPNGCAGEKTRTIRPGHYASEEPPADGRDAETPSPPSDSGALQSREPVVPPLPVLPRIEEPPAPPPTNDDW